jgi:hypothetical protein
MPNKFQPHVMVLPEDDANRQLANGFLLDPGLALRGRVIQVLEEAGGWGHVIEQFLSDHVPAMRRYTERRMVLLIDFDRQGDRFERFMERIPDDLKDRVFVIGPWIEPEALKPSLGSYEEIGRALAKDCREETEETWGHEHLTHNSGELERLRTHVRPFLFEP